MRKPKLMYDILPTFIAIFASVTCFTLAKVIIEQINALYGVLPLARVRLAFVDLCNVTATESKYNSKPNPKTECVISL